LDQLYGSNYKPLNFSFMVPLLFVQQPQRGALERGMEGID
jgi:hypothetical protein